MKRTKIKLNRKGDEKKLKFLDLVEKLQKQNEGYIVLVKNGIFFVGVGKDAILLNEMINLKLTCMRPNTCKVGFQVKSVEKYINSLNKKGKAYVLFAKNESEQIEEIYRYNGEKVFETNKCKDCSKCLNKPETENEILERVKKLGKN